MELMFWKKYKKCASCGKKLERDWDFCPYCGENIKVVKRRSLFEDIDKEFERIDRMFTQGLFNIPNFKMRFPMRGGGISITIHSETGTKPKVNIKTFGEYKKIEPELKRKFGITEGIKEIKEWKEGGREEKKREIRVPKITEEPETKVKNLGTKEIIEIKLPDVKNTEDIELKELEQSIEIKAFAGDKTYFKLIPMKPNYTVVGKTFQNGILKLEIGM